MAALDHLLANNRAWAHLTRAHEPHFFEHLEHDQHPRYLWIGCSDSRVPPSEILGLLPGQLFVHRNIANLVASADLNSLSVLQYAVNTLQVEHIIVGGHYGCGGIEAAMGQRRHDLLDAWLHPVHELQSRHADELARIDDSEQRLRRLCELNVLEQVVNVCRTPIVRNAWALGRSVTVHGWVYNLHDGLLRDLGLSVSDADQMRPRYEAAVQALDDAPPPSD